MYFPIGWPRELKSQEDGTPLVHVSANVDRLLFAVLTHNTLAVWYCQPAAQIVSFRRSDNSVSQFGENLSAQWKPDSSMIAITTSKGYIIFFKVDATSKGKSKYLFVQRDDRGNVASGEHADREPDNIPALTLTQTAYIQVAGGVHSIVCLREELLVATGIGWLQRIRWDGMINADMTIEVSTIPFSVDLQQSRASQLAQDGVYVRQFQYSMLLGGFAVVLSDGKAAFMTANSLKFEPNQVVGVWAQEVRDATAVAVNHKYTLLAFGCKDGEGLVYHLDELTGALVVSHKLVVSSKDFPDCGNVCGSVRCMRWTPDGRALAMCWSKGGFSLWSVFGALLLHSLGANSSASFSGDLYSFPLIRVRSMEWGSEGYHMWLVSEQTSDVTTTEENHVIIRPQPKLMQMYFVKSSLTVNPCMSSHEHLFLQGQDKLYLSTEEAVSLIGAGSDATEHQSAYLMNKQWQTVPITHTYLKHNWPIRFTAVNLTGHLVAVAGKTGLAHYALFTRKWKVFGNETQERDMVVTGGLSWWNDFICCACYNLIDQRDEVRFYPRECKLDNTFAQVVRVPSQIMLLNTFRDILVVLCADCHVMLFKLTRTHEQNYPTVKITKIQEVAVGNFIPHPATVVAINLTTIRTETAVKVQAQSEDDAESIILNVAGRLLMFQRDRSGPQSRQLTSKQRERPLPFCAPVMVASSVENMWYCIHKSQDKPHLTEALWLGCGAAGMKVWLPLHQKEDIMKRSFMSRRIMLPFKVNIYPLAVQFESGILLGAWSESHGYGQDLTSSHDWAFMHLERTNQVYLPHVLRQLLRRNLGVHALDVARCCRDLQYFPHVLELLIHEVLDEEATSKEPIPDPLLPRVVAFVHEFPEFFQVIAHCARKTEVALWQYFFNTVGDPKDLFEECLEKKELDTAGSYLIILQNMEQPSVARQHATLLLDAALEQCMWDLAKDIVRFLKAIDPCEADSPHSTMRHRISTGSMYGALSPSPVDGAQFAYPNPPKAYPSTREPTPLKQLAATPGKDGKKEGKEKKEAAKDGHKPVKASKSDASASGRKRSTSGSGKDDGTAEQFFIDVILSRHARKLLASYRLRDLASFAANLEDYQLVQWLRKERVRAARIEDFVAALKTLHSDFRWPFPLLSLSQLQRLASTNSLSSLAEICQGGKTPEEGTKNSTPTTPSVESNSTVASPTEGMVKSVSNRGLSEDASSFATITELSDGSSLMGDTDNENSSSSWADAASLLELEQLSNELANKGPKQSEIELRYLYQIVMEAGCLEWAMVIAILLRDSISVVRVVNTASLTDTPIEIVSRMREGLSYLELWADTQSFGYKPFLQTIVSQRSQLDKIVEDNLATSRLKLSTSGTSNVSGSSSRTRTTSTSSTDSRSTVGTLEPQASMEREIVGEEGAGPIEEGLEDTPTSPDDQGCAIS